MVVEPMAGDSLEDNLNPVGRLYDSASTMICVPTSLAQETSRALGAQAGETRLAEVTRSAGSAMSAGGRDPAQHDRGSNVTDNCGVTHYLRFGSSVSPRLFPFQSSVALRHLLWLGVPLELWNIAVGERLW
jgi:hypothetical protein